MGQRIQKYSEIVELARVIENLRGKEKGAKEWESREQVKSIRSTPGNFGDSSRKRQREPSQPSWGQQSYEPHVSLGESGVSPEPRVICFKCKQPGHVRSQCHRPPKSCHRYSQLGHLERNCP
ncbi:hypothetical protein Vadar_017103 [Vaccinium darrowii]|uniref:Uncharacterized protein n=1 Tax=Vaccinium darrowii TaxID=229202 RepID=A0ACB7X1C1_9ERIC|nr:hypothetical protein Vadar_017103 [Vaccinium darrowii]